MVVGAWSVTVSPHGGIKEMVVRSLAAKRPISQRQRALSRATYHSLLHVLVAMGSFPFPPFLRD